MDNRKTPVPRPLSDPALLSGDDFFLPYVSDAIILTDLEFRIVDWNLAAEKTYGWPIADARGERLGELLLTEFRLYPAEEVTKILSETGSWQGELVQTTRTGNQIDINASINVIPTPTGDPAHYLAIYWDISINKQVEIDLNDSVKQLELVIDSAKLGVWGFDLETNNVTWNQHQFEIYGLDRQQYVLRPFNYRKFTHPDDLERGEAAMQKLLAGQSFHREPIRIVRLNGEVRHLLASASPIINNQGEVIALQGINIDVSERIEAETALHRLAKELVVSREKERRQIARELHDDVGQTLTAMALSLQSLRDDSPGQDLGQRVDEIIRLTNVVTDKVRHLSYGLHPPLLETIGLNAALEAMCEEFAKLASLQIHYDGNEVANLAEGGQIGLYRILQEGLANVGKHAQAKNVYVKLQASSGNAKLTVADDGRGFVIEKERGGPDSMGLGILSMRERTTILGGVFTLRSEPSRGTKICVEVPMGPAHD